MNNSLVLYEDDHLLVVNKPSGINTHRPNPYTSEGIYDWLKCREPRWAELATLHRLDKETSGVLVFGKTKIANQSLADQFAKRKIKKTYLLLTDCPVPQGKFTVRSQIIRKGDHYIAKSLPKRIDTPMEHSTSYAETTFKVVKKTRYCTLVEAHPATGRTHQIRVHAAWSGFPILGDELYGGAPIGEPCLHAVRLILHHPVTGQVMTFETPPPFSILESPGIISQTLSLREPFIDPAATDSYRVFHSVADGWEGIFVDKFGDRLLFTIDGAEVCDAATKMMDAFKVSQPWVRTIWEKVLLTRPGKSDTKEASPRLVWSKNENLTPETEFLICENSVQYKISFTSGYSVGIFFDQRDNRRRILTHYVAPDFMLTPGSGAEPKSEMLNAFAYTCAFSVCGALAGYRVTSLDLSRKYLDWGKENMILNGIDPEEHDFIFGDVFDWGKRFLKKGRTFDFIVLDPPTFSRSHASGIFKADSDMGKLTATWLPLLRKGGVILISTNCATLPPADFESDILAAVASAGRRVLQSHFATQSPDFPACTYAKAYLKTLWLRIE